MAGKILAMCATRDRNLALERMIDSFLSTSTEADLAIYIDRDQKDLYGDIRHPRISVLYGERLGPVGSLNGLHETFPGYDVYGSCTDDCEFRTRGWEAWVLNHRDKPCLLAPKLPGSRRMDFPWATKEWIDALGYFALPSLEHYYWDVCLELLGESLGAIHYAGADDFTIAHDDAIDPDITRKLEHDAKLAIGWIALGRPKEIAKMKAALWKSQSVNA